MTESARTFPHSVVTARCIDCGVEFTGPLGVRFIELNEGTGLEIVVCSEKRNELHTIARVLSALVPTVHVADYPSPHIGTA